MGGVKVTVPMSLFMVQNAKMCEIGKFGGTKTGGLVFYISESWEFWSLVELVHFHV